MSRLVLLVLVICATAMFATGGERFLHGLGGNRPLGVVADQLAALRNRPDDLVKADASKMVTSRDTPELIEVAFAPYRDDAALRLVVKTIDSGARTIEVAVYEFTSKPVADALIRAVHRGVKVYLVADAQENPGKGGSSRVDYVAAAGVAVRLDDVYPIMHDKFIVVDADTVETGSFNYTHAAQRKNAENELVLWHAPAVARLYAEHFSELWAESRPID
ncbi:PLD-like domain-containing protein [Rhizobiales bacterium GAS113]|nr:PLD-like domain-containing protein [Rhizobiales bacterium GAS113]